LPPVVTSCDAVDAESEWLRLRPPSGPVRSIPWSAIRWAGFSTDDGQMSFGGDLEQATALGATHDPLWIAHGEGVALAMLEKQHPKRAGIDAAFRQQLGERWLEGMTSSQVARRVMVARANARPGVPKRLLWALGIAIAMAILPAIAMLIIKMIHG
jgi:hypothetical protein